MKTKEEKKRILEDLKNKFNQATGYILVNLLNLSTKDQKKVKDVLKQNNSLFQVTKKTLVYKANPNFPISEETIKFPLGFIWNFDDSISAFRSLKAIKKDGVNLSVISGYLNGKVLTKEEVWELAQLPSKEELIQKSITGLKTPIFSLVFSLKSSLQKLILILSQIKSSKKD
ncbi:MAG: 50S ribosomal protein L10 [Candidatus Parcubacteria bacterium]|nr:MAG: 50S ribosomal protein L10 [Candidatus Parcubacteria bacterium]